MPRRWLAITLMAFLLASCSNSQPAASPASSPGLLVVGSRAPGFSLPTPTGQTLSLTSFAGKPVIVEFLATW